MLKLVHTKFRFITLFLALTFLMAGCSLPVQESINPKVVQLFEIKEDVYTQRNMFISTFGKHGEQYIDTTNYGNRVFIPVNTKVKLRDINFKKISFTYDGNLVILTNNVRYSKTTIEEVFWRYFGEQKVDLSKFTKLERNAINAGLLSDKTVPGMRKEAVLVSRGFPPAHKTSSLKADKWRYWQNQWDSVMISFKDNNVTSINEVTQ